MTDHLPDGAARSRRAFLQSAGLGGAALMLAACSSDAGMLSPDGPKRFINYLGTVILDFSKDVDVLNYAYALEQLEAAFYARVVSDAAFTSTFSANEQVLLRDIRDHEIVHRDFFAAALGTAKIPNLTPNFSSVNFANRTSVLTTARTFEDLGVSAYNGAARYIQNVNYLLVAGKIVSVEARHASAIRDVLAPRTGAFAPDAFDPATPPSAVIAAAAPFITERIIATNA